jgi:hypothetical protein
MCCKRNELKKKLTIWQLCHLPPKSGCQVIDLVAGYDVETEIRIHCKKDNDQHEEQVGRLF